MKGILWLFSVISIIVLIALSPFLDSLAAWALTITIVEFLLWWAIRATTGWNFHHALGVLAAVLAVFVRGICRRIGNINHKPPKSAYERQKIAKSTTDLVRFHRNILAKGGITVIVGYKGRKPVYVDLCSQHTLIGGSTGGGKTSLINSMLIQVFSGPKKPKVYIVDLKGNKEDALNRWGAVAEYVDTVEGARDLLLGLVDLMNERNKSPEDGHILLVIDEVADLTDKGHDMTSLLKQLARKSRSAGIFCIFATQHPTHDVLKKGITHNLTCKICLPVATWKQAEVIMGFVPKGDLPKQPGEFILVDGLKVQMGRTFRVTKDEIDTALAKRLSVEGDPRLRLWKLVAMGRDIGDTTPGIGKLYDPDDGLHQTFVKFGKRHLVLAGVLEPPGPSGNYRIKIPFIEGVGLVRKYIEEGKWAGQPEAMA